VSYVVSGFWNGKKRRNNVMTMASINRNQTAAFK